MPRQARPSRIRLAALGLAVLLAAPSLATPSASPEEQLATRVRAALAAGDAPPMPVAFAAYATPSLALLRMLHEAGIANAPDLPAPDLEGLAALPPTWPVALRVAAAQVLGTTRDVQAWPAPDAAALLRAIGTHDLPQAMAAARTALPGGPDLRTTGPAALRLAWAVEHLEAALLAMRTQPGCGPLGLGSWSLDVDHDGQPDVVVDDSGTDGVHAVPATLLIDTSGDDRYDGGMGGAGPQRVGVLIDLCGDDTYASVSPVAQGGTVSGLAMLVDAAGNDAYTAAGIAQGTGALGGIGVLWDQAGDDTYAAGAFAQGTGFGGLGVLLDAGGDDHYVAGAMAQGAGVARILYDQGEGIVAPGFGLLADSGGRNLWAAVTIAQGAGFGGMGQEGATLSLGALVHGDGGDGFVVGSAGETVPIIQGQAAADRVSRAWLLGGGGDDVYAVAALQLAEGTGVNLTARGQAWSDSGYAVLFDTGGNDTRFLSGVALGVEGGDVWVHASGQAMTEGGTAQLVDLAGDDASSLQGAALSLAVGSADGPRAAGLARVEVQGQGWATIGGVGTLHDAAGNDAYRMHGLAAPIAAAAHRIEARLGAALPVDCGRLDLGRALAGARFDACAPPAFVRDPAAEGVDVQGAAGDAQVVVHGQGYSERASIAGLGDALGDDVYELRGIAQPFALAERADLLVEARDAALSLTLGCCRSDTGAASLRIGDADADVSGQGAGYQQGQGALLDDGGSDAYHAAGAARPLLLGHALAMPGAGGWADDDVQVRASVSDTPATRDAARAGAVAHALGMAVAAAMRGQDASGLPASVAPVASAAPVAFVGGGARSATAAQGFATFLSEAVLLDAGPGSDALRLDSDASPSVGVLSGSIGAAQADALDRAASRLPQPDDAAFQRGAQAGATDVGAGFDAAFLAALGRGCAGASLGPCVARSLPDGYASLVGDAWAEAASEAAGIATRSGLDASTAAQRAGAAVSAFAGSFRAALPPSGPGRAVVVLGASQAGTLGQGVGTTMGVGAAWLGEGAQASSAAARADLGGAVVGNGASSTAVLVNGALNATAYAQGWAMTLSRGAMMDQGGDDAYLIEAHAARDAAVRALGGDALDLSGIVDAHADGRAAGLDRSTALFLDAGGHDTYGAPWGADGAQWGNPDHTSVARGVDAG